MMIEKLATAWTATQTGCRSGYDKVRFLGACYNRRHVTLSYTILESTIKRARAARKNRHPRRASLVGVAQHTSLGQDKGV